MDAQVGMALRIVTAILFNAAAIVKYGNADYAEDACNHADRLIAVIEKRGWKIDMEK